MAGLAPSSGYGPNAGRSGSDPRGRLQNQSQYQQQRFEQQQGPVANQAGYNYGRGSQQAFQDYGNIMSKYNDLAGGGGGVSGGRVSYDDPYGEAYGKYQDFSNTGGYSADDMSNMRARGIAPVRAAYANAGREVSRQRSLQGGYSPNATAVLAKMAREQGQSAADASTNVEANLAQMRNQGRQFGISGMKGIGDQRLNAQLDAGKFNASMQFQEGAQNQNARLNALQGMNSLYGTTPGMASTFGNQAIDAVNSGGNFGSNLMQNERSAQDLPGQFDTTMNRVNRVGSTVASAAYPFLDYFGQRQKQKYGGDGRSYEPSDVNGWG
jgi:hypothetical protein